MLRKYLLELRAKAVPLAVVFCGCLLMELISRYFYQVLPTSPSVIIGPSGVALAATIFEGYLVWPAVALAALVASLAFGGSPFFMLGSVIGDTLQPLIGLYLLQRMGFERGFFKLKDVFALVVACLISAAVAPSVTTDFVLLHNVWFGMHYAVSIGSWWLGSAVSALIFSAFFVRWVKRPVTARPLQRYAEIAVPLLILFVSSYYLFWTAETALYGISYIFPMIAALFWLAFRGGARFTTLGLFGMTLISLAGAVFGTHVPGTSPAQFVISSEAWDILMALFFFILVSLEEQRRTAMQLLQTHALQLEDALAKIRMEDNAKTEFIALLGHELRNPLASLLSSVELMALSDPPEKERMELLASMDQRIRAVARMLDDILDISRIAERKFILRKERLNVYEVACRAIKAVEPIILKRQLAFVLAFPDRSAEMEADPTRLEQIMINLLHNAAKYTEPGGRIDFGVARDELDVLVTVSDTGVGIEPNMQRRIFEPFVQLNRKGSAGGIGVGLSLTRSLVELHDGTIAVYSEGVGRGSTFTVRLPGALAAEPERTSNASEENSRPPHLKILIVDDNEAALEGLGKLLTLRGHETALASSGSHAIGSALQFKPDVIFLDIGLPDMTGYEVAEKLRGANIPSIIIALSGYGQAEDKRRAQGAGFDYHLTKPVGLAEIEPLLSHVTRVC